MRHQIVMKRANLRRFWCRFGSKGELKRVGEGQDGWPRGQNSRALLPLSTFETALSPHFGIYNFLLLTNFSLKSSAWTRAFLALRRMLVMISWLVRGVTVMWLARACFFTRAGSIPQGLTHFGLGPLRVLCLPYMGRAKTGSARSEKANKRQTSWEGRGSCQPPGERRF